MINSQLNYNLNATTFFVNNKVWALKEDFFPPHECSLVTVGGVVCIYLSHFINLEAEMTRGIKKDIIKQQL